MRPPMDQPSQGAGADGAARFSAAHTVSRSRRSMRAQLPPWPGRSIHVTRQRLSSAGSIADQTLEFRPQPCNIIRSGPRPVVVTRSIDCAGRARKHGRVGYYARYRKSSIHRSVMFISILLIIAAYLLGAISTAIIACRLLGATDPRTVGSGNPGATNVLEPVAGARPASPSSAT